MENFSSHYKFRKHLSYAVAIIPLSLIFLIFTIHTRDNELRNNISYYGKDSRTSVPLIDVTYPDMYKRFGVSLHINLSIYFTIYRKQVSLLAFILKSVWLRHASVCTFLQL